MVCRLRTNFIPLAIINLALVQSKTNISNGDIYDGLKDHTMVTDKELFPYVVSILKMASYLSAGAMICDSWILTAADALFTMRESVRQLRVRMGSINYKKGGLVLPIKYFRIHPYFDDRIPIYDLALLRLSQPVLRTTFIRPIEIKRSAMPLTSLHYVVTAWMRHNKKQISNSIARVASTEVIHRNRHLMVRQMHPINTEECLNLEEKLEIKDAGTLLCLDSNIGSEKYSRDAGAPVVVNGILWGIVSSWKQENYPSGPSFANLVFAPNIRSWIDAVIKDLHWKLKKVESDEENNVLFQ